MREERYYEVWSEGYAATGESGKAHRLIYKGDPDTMWKGFTFQQACVRAMNELGWGKLSEGTWVSGRLVDGYEDDDSVLVGVGHSLYDPEHNTYWGCRFFDNEEDARKSFG